MKISVEILQVRGNVVLLAWNDAAGIHRAYVPSSQLEAAGEGHQVELSELQAGVPYGECWEALPLGSVGADRVAQAIRAHGIWTKQEALAHLPQLRAAIQNAYAQDLQVLLRAIRS